MKEAVDFQICYVLHCAYPTTKFQSPDIKQMIRIHFYISTIFSKLELSMFIDGFFLFRYNKVS